MGIAAALGDLLGLVVKQYPRLAAHGQALGLGLAFAASHLLTGLLHGIIPSDPPTYVAVTGVLAVVALRSSYLPALRVTRVDPIIALKQE